MPRERRHAEWFGPDYARGPVLSGSPAVAAVQVAAQLAQLRAPLTRSDDDLASHAEFIRLLADRLCPDYAAAIRFSVGAEQSNTVNTLIRVDAAEPTLLNLWLADAKGGGLTAFAPNSVTFSAGSVIQTLAANKHYLVLAPATGVISVDVAYTGDFTWYWAAARHGRVVYSNGLDFNP